MIRILPTALALVSLSAPMSLTCDSAQTPQSWTFGPFQITEYPPESGIPDSATLYSRWANTAAPTIDVGPLPSLGTAIILQADIPGLFVFDARYTIQPGDTPQSVAQSMVQTFNAGAGYPSDAQAMQQAGVIAGNVPGTTTIWVTNPISGGVVTLSDQSPQPTFVNVKAGASAWDAGPVIACGKIPQAGSQGISPPPGSNICQFFAVAYRISGRRINNIYANRQILQRSRSTLTDHACFCLRSWRFIHRTHARKSCRCRVRGWW